MISNTNENFNQASWTICSFVCYNTFLKMSSYLKKLSFLKISQDHQVKQILARHIPSKDIEFVFLNKKYIEFNKWTIRRKASSTRFFIVCRVLLAREWST